jgi:hypothetical protein
MPQGSPSTTAWEYPMSMGAGSKAVTPMARQRRAGAMVVGIDVKLGVQLLEQV